MLGPCELLAAVLDNNQDAVDAQMPHTIAGGRALFVNKAVLARSMSTKLRLGEATVIHLLASQGYYHEAIGLVPIFFRWSPAHVLTSACHVVGVLRKASEECSHVDLEASKDLLKLSAQAE